MPDFEQERDFFGALNYIKTAHSSTCLNTWDLYVELALPALGSAAFVLLVPSPGEVIEEYLHPRTGRKDHKQRNRNAGRRQTSRFGQARWWQRISVPDVDELVAQHVPGRGIHAGRQAGGLERWFWQGIDILDRVAWYFLVIDIAENFVYNWASEIMEAEYCKSPVDCTFSGVQISDTYAATFNREDVGTTILKEKEIVPDWPGPELRYVFAIPLRGTLIGEVQLEITDDDPSTIEGKHIWLSVKREFQDQGFEQITGSKTELTGAGTFNCSVSADMNGSNHWIFEAHTDADFNFIELQQTFRVLLMGNDV